MLSMNGSAISHNVDSSLYTSYNSSGMSIDTKSTMGKIENVLNVNIHNIVIQNCMTANIHAK